MKLSFIIPAHNEQGYLGRCLESIFREQERGNHDVEVIVVNNASTDATRKVAESFNRVIIVDEPKTGLPQARQSGFAASHGDLISNVDADTILTPGWIERVFAEFSRDETLVALSGPFVYYDLTAFANFLVKSFFALGFIINMLSRLIFRKGSVIQGGNFILKRTALEKIEGVSERRAS